MDMRSVVVHCSSQKSNINDAKTGISLVFHILDEIRIVQKNKIFTVISTYKKPHLESCV